MARGKSRGNNDRGGGFRGSGSRGGNRGKNYRGGRGRGGPPPVDFDIVDYQVQMWPEYNSYDSNRGSFAPQGRGRGRGSRGSRGSTPASGGSTPTRGRGSYRGRGRSHAGIGSPTQLVKKTARSKLGQDVPLSTLLYETRPLLRPIVFVRSTATPFLFQEGEELLKPVVEDVGDVEESHVPTANRVARVFSGMGIDKAGPTDSDDEELEEIEFNKTEKLLDVAAKPVRKPGEMNEEQFTGFYNRDTSTADQRKAVASQGIPSSRVEAFEERIAGIALSSPPTSPHKLLQDTNNMLLERQAVGSSLAVKKDVPPRTNRPPTLESRASDDILHMADETREGPAPTPPGAAETPGFYIDTTPAPAAPLGGKAAESAASRALFAPEALGDDDDVIVYVAPHPRSGRATPAITDPFAHSSALRTASILTGLPTISESPGSTEVDGPPTNEDKDLTPPPPTLAARFAKTRRPRQFVSPLLLSSPVTQRKAKLRVRRHKARLAKGRKGKGKQSMFSLAAARQDLEWQQDLEERDPRWDERRRGDSDIDWGGEGESESEKGREGVSSGREEMSMDPDLLDEKTLAAFGSFADGMLSQEGSRFVTVDDIADADKLQEEDEAGQGGPEGSSGEDTSDVENQAEREESAPSDEDQDLEDALLEEELKMVVEDARFDFWHPDDDDDDDDASSDDGLSPRSNFQTRLERLRKLTRRGGVDASAEQHSSSDAYEEEDNADDFEENFKWAEEDDELIQHIEDLLSENQDILLGRNRKQKKRLFKAINDGDYDHLSEFTVARRKKDKGKGLPLSLQQRWVKDREKKAELKAARAAAGLEATADPMTKKKGGKKGRKAMLAASRLDPKTTIIGPNRVIDMTTLVQQIKRFLATPDGPQTMTLPPANKHTRKLIHKMAQAFNMKSQSKGRGTARYTTLTKTSRSGLFVNEQKISQILRQSQGDVFWNDENDDKERKRKAAVPERQKEGEEVGKAAPKIDSNNVGFKMLEAMGWSDGTTIGVAGGLDKPLTAIIKHSKLGLGATRG